MATTSFLCDAQGLTSYRHWSTEFQQGKVYHHVELKREGRRCRHCGARWHDLTLSGAFERHFRALPVGHHPPLVVLHGHRQHCERCDRYLREPIRFAEGKARHLKAFCPYSQSCRYTERSTPRKNSGPSRSPAPSILDDVGTF